MYGNNAKISARVLRRVWRAVTARPHASMWELATELGYVSLSSVKPALHALRAAGYISFDDREVRARTIDVPFIAIKRGR